MARASVPMTKPFNVDTGAVAIDGSLVFPSGDANAVATAQVMASAYSNSFDQPDDTAMFNLDAGLSALLQQILPNDGILATIGELGIHAPGEVMGFDIQITEEMQNIAWLVTNNTLDTVDLACGAAIQIGPVESAETALRDLTIMPVM